MKACQLNYHVVILQGKVIRMFDGHDYIKANNTMYRAAMVKNGRGYATLGVYGQSLHQHAQNQSKLIPGSYIVTVAMDQYQSNRAEIIHDVVKGNFA